MTTLRFPFVLTGKVKTVLPIIALAAKHEQECQRAIHQMNSIRVVDSTWRKCPEGQGECTAQPQDCDPERCKAAIERLNKVLKNGGRFDVRD